MSFLVVANFKSHKTMSEVESWVQAVSPVAEQAKDLKIAVAPAFPHLSLLASSCQLPDSHLSLAAQNVSPFPPGSYTGEVNAAQLKDLDISYAIVGHSERRRYFHESGSDIANKVKELLEVGITPIVCLSEGDIVAQRAALLDEQIGRCIFCFEPPSAIGGTETATIEEIKRVTDIIKAKYDTKQVMYGGSVNADDIASLTSLDLFGVLVASACLDQSDFIRLLDNLVHVA